MMYIYTSVLSVPARSSKPWARGVDSELNTAKTPPQWYGLSACREGGQAKVRMRQR